MAGEIEARKPMGPATTPHCGVILAASARIRAMRSWLMRKTNRRLAIYRQERRGTEDRAGATYWLTTPQAGLSVASPPPSQLTSTTELLLRRHLEPHSTGRPSI